MSYRYKESRLELKTRLKASGDWKAFIELREKYKTAGFSPAEAWRMARQKFSPPPDDEEEDPDSERDPFPGLF